MKSTPPPKPPPTMDEEASRVRDELLKSYGWYNYAVAGHIAQLRNTLRALRLDQLSAEERDHCYTRASLQLAGMISLLVPEASEVSKILECARRMDTVVDQFVLDDVEKMGGLPPMPPMPKP